MMATAEKIIRRAYMDMNSPSAFAGIEKVYEEARKQDPKITKSQVKEYLENEPTYSIHKPSRIRYQRLRIVPTGLNSDWQADLAILNQISKYNDGYPYLLVCIDVLSRRIKVAPAKSKSTSHMIAAFDEIWKKAGTKPNRLTTDRGLEFESGAMKNYFHKHQIQKNVVYSDDLHAAMVERSNRTIKSRLYKYFTQYRTWRWIGVIDRIVEDINNSVNRSIGVTPNSVTMENSQQLLRKVYKQPDDDVRAPKYKVGDLVRIDHRKGVFTKSYLPSYTEEIFRIRKAREGNPPYYRIEDLHGEEVLGAFYNENFSKTSLAPNSRIAEVLRERTNRATGVKEALVKWIGERQEKWIPVDGEQYRFLQ